MENPDRSKKSVSAHKEQNDNAVPSSRDSSAHSGDSSVPIGPIPEPNFDEQNRRGVDDRRSNDRRRSARGLFEFRARRDNVDRRQEQRRAGARFRLAFWRR